jgi:hypothetical protein
MGAFTRLSYHVIFGTRYRKPVIHDDFGERLELLQRHDNKLEHRYLFEGEHDGYLLPPLRGSDCVNAVTVGLRPRLTAFAASPLPSANAFQG